jgi:hypothetical protein
MGAMSLAKVGARGSAHAAAAVTAANTPIAARDRHPGPVLPVFTPLPNLTLT